MIQLEMQWLIFLIVIYFLVTYIAYSQNYKNAINKCTILK